MIPIKPRRILAWVLFCSLRTQTYLRLSRVRPILLNMLSLRSTNNNNNIFYLNTVGFKVNIAYGAVCFWRFEYSQTTRKLFRDSIIATYLCIGAIRGTNFDVDSQFNRLRDGSKMRGSLVSTTLYKQQEEWSQPSRLQINLKYFASLEEEVFCPHFGYSTGKTNG